MTCLVARALKNLFESDSVPPPGVASVVLGLPRGPPPSMLQPLVEATHTDWTLLHSTTGCLAHQLMSSRSIVLSKQSLKVKKYFQHSWNEYQKNWPLLKNYFFRPKKTSENKTWMVSYPMKFLRPLLRLPVGRKFAILPLSKNSWRSHNKEANEKTFDFMRPTTLFCLNFSKH